MKAARSLSWPCISSHASCRRRRSFSSAAAAAAGDGPSDSGSMPKLPRSRFSSSCSSTCARQRGAGSRSPPPPKGAMHCNGTRWLPGWLPGWRTCSSLRILLKAWGLCAKRLTRCGLPGRECGISAVKLLCCCRDAPLASGNLLEAAASGRVLTRSPGASDGAAACCGGERPHAPPLERAPPMPPSAWAAMLALKWLDTCRTEAPSPGSGTTGLGGTAAQLAGPTVGPGGGVRAGLARHSPLVRGVNCAWGHSIEACGPAS
jgi:hypothetical protein